MTPSAPIKGPYEQHGISHEDISNSVMVTSPSSPPPYIFAHFHQCRFPSATSYQLLFLSMSSTRYIELDRLTKGGEFPTVQGFTQGSHTIKEHLDSLISKSKGPKEVYKEVSSGSGDIYNVSRSGSDDDDTEARSIPEEDDIESQFHNKLKACQTLIQEFLAKAPAAGENLRDEEDVSKAKARLESQRWRIGVKLAEPTAHLPIPTGHPRSSDLSSPPYNPFPNTD